MLVETSEGAVHESGASSVRRLFSGACETALTKRVSCSSLGAFRILLCSVLFLEVAQLYYFKDLVFDLRKGPSTLGLSMAPILLLWMLSLAAMAVGWRTRVFAIINYLLAVATLGHFDYWEYHFDYVFLGSSLLMVFAPIAEGFSLDAYRKSTESEYLPSTVAIGWHNLILFIGVGLVYFDSVFFKLASPLWTGGLGMWLPVSYSHVSWLPTWLIGPFLDSEWLMKGLGYLTVAFEASFIFLFWFPPFRTPLLIIGLGLHLGIVVAFPIPWFGLGEAAFFALMLPPSLVRRLDAMDVKLSNVYRKHYSRQIRPAWTSPLGVRTRPRLLATLLVAAMGFALSVQLLCIGFQNNAVYRSVSSKIGEHRAARLRDWTNHFVGRVTVWTGIHSHPVFMDSHFYGYEHILAVVAVDDQGQETWLPMVNQEGNPSWYATGRQWVTWTFRVVGPDINMSRLKAGVRDFSSFWALKNGRDLSTTTFNIMAKKTVNRSQWRAGERQEDASQPWVRVGQMGWGGGSFAIELPSIEAL